jgi:hypothetical protein
VRTSRRAETNISHPAKESTSRLRHEPDGPPASRLAARIHRTHTAQEAEERYVATRTEWIAAMKAATTGRPSDMAALAIAQEAYEMALVERERWLSGQLVAIPVEPEAPRDIEVVVGQEILWRQAHQPPARKAGMLRRALGRLTRH